MKDIIQVDKLYDSPSNDKRPLTIQRPKSRNISTLLKYQILEQEKIPFSKAVTKQSIKASLLS